MPGLVIRLGGLHFDSDKLTIEAADNVRDTCSPQRGGRHREVKHLGFECFEILFDMFFD
jgi:hypothetical protein